MSKSTRAAGGAGNPAATAETGSVRIPRPRMTGPQRRSQLVDVGRGLFAVRGLDGTTIEEIAAAAGVSKPVIYEHFGSKEGLYTQVVEFEYRFLLAAINDALTEEAKPRILVERAALALLTYIEDRTDGFRILCATLPRPSPKAPFPPCCRTSRSAWNTSCPTNSPAADSEQPTVPCTPRCSWAWWP